VYVYNATGQKLKKVVTQGTSVTTTDYLDKYKYKQVGTGIVTLEYFPTAEGYVSLSGTNYVYTYQYLDNLGNTRLSYTDADKNGIISTTEIIEENNFYPFGLKHTGYNNITTSLGNSTAQKIKYQKQERQDELGLNWDSFKWRNYSSDLGRFWVIDPLSEKYAYNGVYNFSENRVVDGRELEGLEWMRAIAIKHPNPSELKQQLPPVDAQRQHYAVTVENSKKTFSQFKSDFVENPQDFLTNSKATFSSPVDGDGNKSDFKKGNFINITIAGIFTNNYVKVVGMENKENSLTTTFGTMEGHMEKGKITFKLSENKDGSITFSIDSQSEIDNPLIKTFGEDRARSEQRESWKEVLNKIEKYLGGDTTKKESKTSEPKKKKS
jgi:RHS repeat-associated protein